MSSSVKKFRDMALLDVISSFLGTTGGRDKLCRLFQYFGKFLAAYYTAKARTVENGKEIFKDKIRVPKLISSNMSMTRKVLRFGREYPALLKINSLIMNYFYNKEKFNGISKLGLHSCDVSDKHSQPDRRPRREAAVCDYPVSDTIWVVRIFLLRSLYFP